MFWGRPLVLTHQSIQNQGDVHFKAACCRFTNNNSASFDKKKFKSKDFRGPISDDITSVLSVSTERFHISGGRNCRLQPGVTWPEDVSRLSEQITLEVWWAFGVTLQKSQGSWGQKVAHHSAESRIQNHRLLRSCLISAWLGPLLSMPSTLRWVLP